MPDLQVWQDNSGVYNVPVHAFYLFDPKRNRYVRAKALEAAIGGRDIDHIDNGRFVLRAKVSPCCAHAWSKAVVSICATRSRLVAVAIWRDGAASPQRSRHELSARAIGSNGRLRGAVTWAG